AFFSRFSAFFSFIVLAGFFFCSFFWFRPLLMAYSWRAAPTAVAVLQPSMRLPRGNGGGRHVPETSTVGVRSAGVRRRWRPDTPRPGHCIDAAGASTVLRHAGEGPCPSRRRTRNVQSRPFVASLRNPFCRVDFCRPCGESARWLSRPCRLTRDEDPMKLKLLLATTLALAGIAPVAAADGPRDAMHLVPVPQSIQAHPGELRFSGTVALDADASAPVAARAVRRALDDLGIVVSDAAPVRIRLQTGEDAARGEEGYRLAVADGISLRAQTDTGLLHAVQTLRQLLPAQAQPEYRLARLEIADAPVYRWRGLSLDVARSFLPLAYVEKTIDRMAFFKLNRLHLHLTDDQGWRIEIRRYPKLVEIGGASAVQGGRSGWYTQDELRYLVAYAQARGITIVPEIDMPGHVQAALASYNELACDDEDNLAPYSGLEVGFSVLCLDKPDVVYPFVREVLEEVLAIFPSQEIHI